jgi:SAM-dependent methyltransferase
MGIDHHGLNFLRYAKKKRLLGDTVTIGRQGIHVFEPTLKELVQTKSSYMKQEYCEELLTEYFGATTVDSIDNSDFEKATYIHDMNEPLPKSLYGKYDTVIDGGTLEHVYNAPQALKNCSQLCKPGGQILHILPANNYCGHGFWQYSPELFFSLYSEKNGYSETEVFMADLSDTTKWYQVKKPVDGDRALVTSSTALYALAKTVLTGPDFSHSRIQQSDYLYEWANASPGPQEPGELAGDKPKERLSIKQKLKKVPFAYKVLSPAYRLYQRSKKEAARLDRKNPDLIMIDLSSHI